MRCKWDLEERTVPGVDGDRDLMMFRRSLCPFLSRRRNDAKHHEALPPRCASRVFRVVLMAFAAAVSLSFPMRCRRRFVCDAVGGGPSMLLFGTGEGSRSLPPALSIGEKLGKTEHSLPWSWGGLGIWGGSIFASRCPFYSLPVVVFPSLFDLQGGWSPCALRC